MALRKRMVMTMVAMSLAAASAVALAHGGRGFGPGACGGPGAGAPMAGCPGGMRGEGMGMRGGMRGPEAAAARLAEVKDALKLQPAQLPAWNAYESKVKETSAARVKMREGMVERRGNPDAMSEFRVTMTKFNAQAAEELHNARKAFVAALTPEQKASFDKFGPGMGPMAGGRGMGPGHGGGQRGPGCRAGAPSAA